MKASRVLLILLGVCLLGAAGPGRGAVIQRAAPGIVGVGGNVRLTGSDLGSDSNTVIVFSPEVIAGPADERTASAIRVRVPVGAQSGPVRVVTGVDATRLRALQEQIDRIIGIASDALRQEVQSLRAAQQALLGMGSASNSVALAVTFAFHRPMGPLDPYIEEVNGLGFLRNRLIVDLRGPDAEHTGGFESALEIASSLNAELTGYLPVTNSYVLDLRQPPASLSELTLIQNRVRGDSRVADVWLDLLLEAQQVRFADVDVVDRYRRTENNPAPAPNRLHGRTDVWATDRIQAPGAWNLLERFLPGREGQPAGRASLYPVKIAVFDSGADQAHPEFHDVALTQVVLTYAPFRIGAFTVELPTGAGEEGYDGGDPGFTQGGVFTQHGTAVTALIGADNGETLPGATDGDRGINGLLHNPMSYTIQIHSAQPFLRERWSVAGHIAATSGAVLTRARIVSSSVGTTGVVNPTTSPFRDAVKAALLRYALHLRTLEDKLLLVQAAGNGAVEGDPENMQGRIFSFDFNEADNRGNSLPGSLGVLPNVLVVGALDLNDQRWEGSNWGAPVQIFAPGVRIFTAGEARRGATRLDFLIGDTARYYLPRGTSFAAPLVSGSAALLLGIDPRLAPARLKTTLIETGFPVNTTDGRGMPLVEQPTLKTGFAVRRLLIERGLITNDQEWSGVSRIVTIGAQRSYADARLGLVEIRRDPAGGRAQGFAARSLLRNGLPIIGVSNVALSHDGRRLVYKTADRALLTHSFETGQFGSIGIGGVILNHRALDLSPAGDLLIGATAPIPNDPNQSAYQLLLVPAGMGGARAVATTSRRETQRLPEVYLYDVSWSPDNRAWNLEYAFRTENRTMQGIPLRNAAGQIQTVPLQGGELRKRFTVAPDGAGSAYTSADRLITTYPPIAPRSRVVADVLEDLAWSPDGSELATCAGNPPNGRIIGLRRDARDDEDRAARPIYTVPGGLFNVWTVCWQW